ncbi:MAG: hypothetical protein GX621_15350 [Pirellulaceae bacterium]|nr:hypothetical protein [Pirellulaceae bacterium]
MRRFQRNIVALMLTVAYLAAVGLGHQFHNHGLGGRHCGGCAPSGSTACRTPAREHADNHGHACGHGCHASDSDVNDSPCLASSTASQGSHFCPICHFYSHHGTLPAIGQLPTSAPVCEWMIHAGCPVAARAIAGPQQARAPPFSA